MGPFRRSSAGTRGQRRLGTRRGRDGCPCLEPALVRGAKSASSRVARHQSRPLKKLPIAALHEYDDTPSRPHHARPAMGRHTRSGPRCRSIAGWSAQRVIRLGPLSSSLSKGEPSANLPRAAIRKPLPPTPVVHYETRGDSDRSNPLDARQRVDTGVGVVPVRRHGRWFLSRVTRVCCLSLRV